MILVRAAQAAGDASLPEIALRVDRQKLSRRLWRGIADDGTDFGFELGEALCHGDVIACTATARYVIRQTAEPLLEIELPAAPGEAAVIGWAVGNLHFTLEARDSSIVAPDDPGLRQALERVGIAYRTIHGVFQPHRFASIVGHAHAPAAEAHPYVRALHGHGR